jgi:hypothetical protein
MRQVLRGLLALLALAGLVAGAGIVVQLAHQGHKLADAAAAREAGYFVGGGHEVRLLAMNDFHDGEKNVVLNTAQAARLQLGPALRKKSVVWYHG